MKDFIESAIQSKKIVVLLSFQIIFLDKSDNYDYMSIPSEIRHFQ